VNWPFAEILAQVAPIWPDLNAECLAELDSSNSELMRRARAGRRDRTLLVVQRQTGGRGRLGRHWVSGESGQDLTFSLGLPWPASGALMWAGLSLAVGLVVARSLSPQIGLKWPNDLYWQKRKLGGILLETTLTQGSDAHPYLVVGVGLNVKSRCGQGLTTAPAWLQEVNPELDAPGTLLAVIPGLAQGLTQFEQHGFSVFRDEFRSRDVLEGRQVRVQIADQPASSRIGRACGITAEGALRVMTPQGLQMVSSAEVSVRTAGGEQVVP
jgi:BirA family biotin operon repressor/biotin-[acetyl-CoA-carboxylase] ligase